MKSLIVYYSHGGNTDFVAKIIADKIEREQNTILLVEPDDRILGKTIMPADVSVRESL